MKHKLNSPGRPAKKPKVAQTELTSSGKSIRELAKPYLLTTAKVLVDDFKFSWSIGTNRSIDRKHVRALYRIFLEQRLQREHEEHHIQGICTKAEVEKVLQHLQNIGKSTAPTRSDSNDSIVWPTFEDWNTLNGTKIELIAGQHRIEALKEYVRHFNLEGDQLWWICDIYDKGIFTVIKHSSLS